MNEIEKRITLLYIEQDKLEERYHQAERTNDKNLMRTIGNKLRELGKIIKQLEDQNGKH